MLKAVRVQLAALCFAVASGPALADGHSGMVMQTAKGTVSETEAAFVALVQKKGATVFAQVDHAAGAQKVDLALKPSRVVIFGNPKIGTPLMQAAPSAGLELPLKVLFFEDEEGQTVIAYPDLNDMAKRHGIPADHPALMKAKGALAKLTGAVAK